MKSIIFNFSDGERHLSRVCPSEFDTQKWAETRREAFAMLQIVSISEEHHDDPHPEVVRNALKFLGDQQ